MPKFISYWIEIIGLYTSHEFRKGVFFPEIMYGAGKIAFSRLTRPKIRRYLMAHGWRERHFTCACTFANSTMTFMTYFRHLWICYIDGNQHITVPSLSRLSVCIKKRITYLECLLVCTIKTQFYVLALYVGIYFRSLKQGFVNQTQWIFISTVLCRYGDSLYSYTMTLLLLSTICCYLI